MFNKLKSLTGVSSKSKTTIAPVHTNIPNDGHAFLSADELLRTHDRYLKAIKDDSEAKTEYYEHYYLSAINRYAEIMQLRPYGLDINSPFHKSGGAIEMMIKRVAMTLKLRKGLLLPKDENPELISQKAALWTYGAFVGALLREVGGQLQSVQLIGFSKEHKEGGVWQGWYNSLQDSAYYKMKHITSITRSLAQTDSIVMLPYILPKDGVAWLHTDSKLLDCLLDQLAGGHKIEDNPIYDLVMDATRAIKQADLVLEGKAEIDSPLNAPEGTKIDLSSGEIITSRPARPEPVPSIPEPPTEVMEDIPPEEPPMNNDPEEEEERLAEPVKKSKPVQQSFTTKTFSKRVLSDLEAGTIKPDDAWMVNTDLHIIYPAAFKTYTESPAELYNDLKLHGCIIEEKNREKGSTNRVLVLRV